MAAVALDTHRTVQRLRAVGLDERQAETVADVSSRRGRPS
jgi:hypothetical protein